VKETLQTQQPDTFTLTLRALPRWPIRFRPVDPEQRLRAELERLLRDHGLRCVTLTPIRKNGEGKA